MSKINFLYFIVATSLIAIVSLGSFSIFFLSTSFANLIKNNAEYEAIKIGQHLSDSFRNADKVTGELPIGFIKMANRAVVDFGLLKIKVFSPIGETVYSSSEEDIGKINKKDYFHNIVAKGKPFTEVINKETKSLEDEVMRVDVVETYVPMMQADNFIGAFEVYLDITDEKNELNNLIFKSSILLFLIATALILAILAISFIAWRSFIKQELAEKKTIQQRLSLQEKNSELLIIEDKLVEINENLESLVRERTEELDITNKNLRQEITVRIQADELLRDSKLRYQNLVESTSDWVWEVDQEGRYTYVNPRIRDLLGYEPEEVIYKTPFDLMPPGEAKRVGEIFATAVARQEPINSLENINLHKDGRLVILETSGLPFFDVGGEFLGYRGIDRDITDRKQSENKLLLQREKLEESNIALRVILKESEITKMELEKNVLSNIKDLLLPYMTELDTMLLDGEQRFLGDIIKENINEITASFSRKLKLEFDDLTPREIQVADLIKQGRTNKEIARLLNITGSGVDHHRRNLRTKLNINNKKINLRSRLLSYVV